MADPNLSQTCCSHGDGFDAAGGDDLVEQPARLGGRSCRGETVGVHLVGRLNRPAGSWMEPATSAPGEDESRHVRERTTPGKADPLRAYGTSIYPLIPVFMALEIRPILVLFDPTTRFVVDESWQRRTSGGEPGVTHEATTIACCEGLETALRASGQGPVGWRDAIGEGQVAGRYLERNGKGSPGSLAADWPIPCSRSGIPDGEGQGKMDRSAWAISLIGAVVSWCAAGPSRPSRLPPWCRSRCPSCCRRWSRYRTPRRSPVRKPAVAGPAAKKPVAPSNSSTGSRPAPQRKSVATLAAETSCYHR